MERPLNWGRLWAATLKNVLFWSRIWAAPNTSSGLWTPGHVFQQAKCITKFLMPLWIPTKQKKKKNWWNLTIPSYPIHGHWQPCIVLRKSDFSKRSTAKYERQLDLFLVYNTKFSDFQIFGFQEQIQESSYRSACPTYIHLQRHPRFKPLYLERGPF